MKLIKGEFLPQSDNLTEFQKGIYSYTTLFRDALNERDRNISAMKEQMKYYINFAENSIHGHLDGKPRNMEAQHEAQVEALVKDLQDAKVNITNYYG